MHYRKIGGNNGVGRMYCVLTENQGKDISGPRLARLSAKDPAYPLTAVGTCVSELRQQLGSGESIKCVRKGGGFFYRYELDSGE